MDFEEKLRTEIYNAPFQSQERQILKLVLGELYRNSSKITNTRGETFVNKTIATNKEQMSRLSISHPRYFELLNENYVLSRLVNK